MATTPEERRNVIQNTVLFLVFMITGYFVLYIAGIEYVATLFIIIVLVVLIAYAFWRIKTIKIQQAEMTCYRLGKNLKCSCRVCKMSRYKKPLLLPRIKDLRAMDLAAAGKYFT